MQWNSSEARGNIQEGTMAEMNHELLQAYVDALYRVEGTSDFKVGEYSEELARLHAAHEARHSHFITAFNPASKRLSAEENAARHAELGQKLDAMKAVHLAAAGLDPEGQWPPEPGYLVFDMADDDVLALGREYEQNAVVAIGADAVPRLVVLEKLV